MCVSEDLDGYTFKAEKITNNNKSKIAQVEWQEGNGFREMSDSM